MNNLEKRDTISIIAHELRTSLIANKWVLQMLYDGDLGTITQEQKLFIEKSLKNNEKMVELVSELVEAGHSETSTGLSFEKINLVEIGLDVVKDFEADAKKKNISLEYGGPTSGIVMAEVNKNKIHSALQELIHNALKYTKSGFVRLTISQVNETHATLSVEDSGMGIPTNEQSKIFEKFWRGEQAKQQEEIGSGLGLFAVQKIAEKHGGTISFESKEGVGSTFTLKIPLTHS